MSDNDYDPEYDPMNPEDEDSYGGGNIVQQYPTVPGLFQPPPPPTPMQNQPMMHQNMQNAAVAPWLMNSKPPPPSIPLQPVPLPSIPLPPHIPMPPIQPLPPVYYQPPPPPRAVVPAPPDSIIPPPPPEESYEAAYSPSQAEDDENGFENDQEKREKQKQRDIENIIIKKEQEAIEHTRRMEAENRKIEEMKKRKMISGFAPIKLKKQKLKGFQVDDDEDERGEEAKQKTENKSKATTVNQVSQSAASNNEINGTEEKEISQETLTLMSQTASYLIHNPTQAPVFMKNKKNDKLYSFLYDVERLTKEGRKFREISEKFLAERNVQNIVNDPVQTYTNTVMAPMPSMMVMAPVTAVVKAIAVDYSAMNPFSESSSDYSPDVRSTYTQSVTSHSNRDTSNSSSRTQLQSQSQPQSLSQSRSSASTSSSSSRDALHTDISPAEAPKASRRNRWGPQVAESSVVTAVPVVKSLPAVSQSQVVTNLFDSTSDERDRVRAVQVREQKEMQLLEARIREAAGQAMVSKNAPTHNNNDNSDSDKNVSTSSNVPSERQQELEKERLMEYGALAARYSENGLRDTIDDAERNRGIIDGGTWEHRKRAVEMLETANKNSMQTLLGKGNHFMGDFLPKQELDKFLKNADALSQGLKVERESDYEAHKIQEDNIGFQMLKKGGWTEGSGLGDGVRSEAILAPLNTAGQGTETVGLGVAPTHQVEEGDDQFDQYRKRMQLAYRFRPNPLNNPRRDYY